MAARVALWRAVRRPAFQMKRNCGVSCSAASRSHFVQVEEHEVVHASNPASTSSKVVIARDDAHFQQAIKQVEGFTWQTQGPSVSSISPRNGKQIAPYIDDLSKEFEDVTFMKVDVDNLKLEETMIGSRISVVPTFHFHKKGKIIGELTGAMKDKLKNLVMTLRAEQQ